MKKTLTAQRLLNFLLQLKENGEDLKSINVLYRYDRDSDEVNVYEVEEDLYDSDSNKILETIMLLTDPSEQ